MNTVKNKEMEKLKKEYNEIPIPENGLAEMTEAIERAKRDKKRMGRTMVYRRAGGCVAAALFIAVLIPNVSVEAAMAMEKIPGLSGIIRVITFGRYDFEDERHEAKVEIPKVEVGKVEETPEQTAKVTESVQSMNKDIEDYIEPIVKEFEDSLEEDYNKSLEVGYEVVTDTDRWFTLKLNVLEIEASGYQYSKYYHIDKATGERASLKDLFREDSDYVTTISEDIKRQMREQISADEGKAYFIDSEDEAEAASDFDQIEEDQKFYFNDKGEIVIAFDEYEAAPGYMGPVEFAIPKEVTDTMRNQ